MLKNKMLDERFNEEMKRYRNEPVQDVIYDLKQRKTVRLILSLIMVIISALLQVYILDVFMEPCNLISGGFTGLSLLVSKVFGLFDIDFSVSFGIILFNVPAAILCYKSVSKRFTFLSCLQFGLVSLLIPLTDFKPIIDDVALNVLFGGFLWGFSIALALRAGASTGGTDFIAQFVSNKINKGIWDYVFGFNCIMYVIFGCFFGWIYAGYSIIFQLLSTRTISSFYQRYSQVTIEFITKDADPVIDAFMATCRHGMSVFEGVGAYRQEKIYACKAVVSSYEVRDVIANVRKVDPHVIVNTYHTMTFYGNFHQKPIE